MGAGDEDRKRDRDLENLRHLHEATLSPTVPRGKSACSCELRGGSDGAPADGHRQAHRRQAKPKRYIGHTLTEGFAE